MKDNLDISYIIIIFAKDLNNIINPGSQIP